MEEDCHKSSEIRKNGVGNDDFLSSEGIHDSGSSCSGSINELLDSQIDPSEHIHFSDLTTEDYEAANDINPDASRKGSTDGRPLDSALKSLYDYTGKIKSFIEQDYELSLNGCEESRDKNNSAAEDYDAAEQAIVNIVSALISTVLADVLSGKSGAKKMETKSDVNISLSNLGYPEEKWAINNDITVESRAVDDATEDATPSGTIKGNDFLPATEIEDQENYQQSSNHVEESQTCNDSSDFLEDSAVESTISGDLLVESGTTDSIPAPSNEKEHVNLAFENSECDLQVPAELENVSNSPEIDSIPLATAGMNTVQDVLDQKNNLEKTIDLNDIKRNESIQKDDDLGDGNSNSVIITGQPQLVDDDYLNNRVDLRPKVPNMQIDEEKRKTFPSESFLDSSALNNFYSNDVSVEMSKVDAMDPDTVCGVGSFRPQWLQQWATSKTFLAFFSIVGVLQGSYYTYLIGIMSTLEKRYAFESKISGTIMMVDEITPLFLGILVGYFGGKSHRPRVVACGMFLSALCCFVSALPYFVYGTSKHLMSFSKTNQTSGEYCERDYERTDQCSVDDRPPTMAAVACLLIGSFMKGFGGLAYYAVGVAYMDDTTKKTNTPIYLAISTAFRLLGPTTGFLMSSAFLNFYENPFDDPGFGPDDPRWIGAWWIGFVLQGLLLCIFSFPVFLFPRRLPRQKQRALSNTANFYQESMPERIRGMFKAVRRLLSNPIFVLFSAGVICSIIGGFGIFTYVPKYMENQFHISASNASLYSGPPSIAAVQICCVIGGILIWKFKPSAKMLISAMLLTSVLDVLAYTLLMIPMCPQLKMTGATITDNGLILENSCNSGCDCSLSVFTPVCGPDGVSTYFSPCHAGCSSSDVENPDKFFNCSCIVDASGNFTFASHVNRGYCPDDKCWKQTTLYVVIMTLMSGVTSLARVAFTLILFRSVDPADKSVAIGTFEMLLCGLGFMPYPVIFGALADSSCLIWEKSCGETGNCWLYDVSTFNYRLHGTSAGFAGASALFFFGMSFLAGRVRNIYEEEEAFPEKDHNRKPTENAAKKNNTTTQL